MGHQYRDRRRHRLMLVPLLCLLLVLPASPAAANDGPTVGAEVLRLYDEVAKATASYERGLHASEIERARTERLQQRLAEQRSELEGLHNKIGAVARAQYRSGGSLAVTAKLLLADDPDEMMRGWQLSWQADLAVNRLLDQTKKAEDRASRAEERARAAWLRLEERTSRLAWQKQGIETKLESAQWMLQGEANRSAASGECSGAERLDQPPLEAGPNWVSPVEHYTLSAGYDSAGGRWSHRHTGQDFAVGIGAPVRSVGEGRVVSVSCGGAFGVEVVIEHAGGWYTQYAHLAGITVDQGELVSTGQWVGQAGTTGNSTGPHLHFEARLTPYYGSAVDPVAWLAERGVQLG
ncbi:M23 family metallopeptidase [Streptomyces formicae]|uniref:Peptidoglycan DD-metalloendopeptidase family protein n=1 Tax=Streptomyces formicae TaxID=1616117 RepID=A0ABY3WY26_9ACTN|nr:M23 family metallopeptidase [Streptomyces formicae]UNM16192.1 peptidoglycan DD-metalloendopeptidase family protein [Streptomyces formicae]